MGKVPCKTKVSYYSIEEAQALSLPGLDIYLCPHCKNYHAASKQSGRKNKNRFNKYKRRK